MSHFAVLVIGDNIEEQLAPYDENIEVPEYAREDNTMTTYNPKSKWDWYQIGGRWTGFFQLKPGGTGNVGEPGLMTPKCAEGFADSAKLKDIDFEGMTLVAAAEANATYDKLEAALDGASLDDMPKFEVIFERVGKENYDAARKEYWAHPLVKRLQEANLMPWGSSVQEAYGSDRATYVKRRSLGSYVPYAVVKDGEWMAKGDMGWFGFSDTKVPADEWNERIAMLLQSLPDDTRLTVVDCHI